MTSRTYRFLIAAFLLLHPALGQSQELQIAKTRYVLTGSDATFLKNLVIQTGGRLISRLRYHSGWIIELAPKQALQIKTTLALRATANAGSNRMSSEEILEPDGKVTLIDLAHPAIVSEDYTLRFSQKLTWGVQAVHAPEAFSVARGKSVTVCVIDTGVQKDHPDLKENIAGGENTIIYTTRPDWRSGDWDDDQGHGTHVAGTIAARNNGIGVVGVAPEAKIFAVKALNGAGSGNFSSVAEGIRSCLNHGAQVINMSIGTEDDSRIIANAVQDAIRAGVVIVAAAGNSKGAVEFPARVPGVIAVSSLSKDRKISYFSSRGPEISFIAPGEEVLSTFPDDQYAYLQGTSQAAPHVAGVAALLISAGVRDASAHLRGSDLGMRREAQGRGCIDASKSLEDLVTGF